MIDEDINKWIESLPEEGNITIKVYNSLYVEYIKDKLARKFGFDYLKTVSFVVPGESDEHFGWDRQIYLSPILHDYNGNGYN